MPNQRLPNMGDNTYDVSGNLAPAMQDQRRKAMTTPADVFNQLAQGGTTIPLFKTLAQVGIKSPEEQQLFFNYARQHGGYDAKTGDFVVPKDKAAELWNAMRNDKDFQLQLDNAKLSVIDRTMGQINELVSNPEIVNRMSPEEIEQITGRVRETNMFRNALIEHTQKLMGNEPQQATDFSINPQPKVGPLQKPTGSIKQDETPKFSDFL